MSITFEYSEDTLRALLNEREDILNDMLSLSIKKEEAELEIMKHLLVYGDSKSFSVNWRRVYRLLLG